MSWTKFNGRQVRSQIRGIVSDELLAIAKDIGDESQKEVPLDTGALANSMHIAKNPGNELEVKIGYGGGGVSGKEVIPYAIRWHENHANFQNGRKMKYLSDPYRRFAPKIRARIARVLNRAR